MLESFLRQGLGLSISYNIVRQQGGTLSVSSQPGCAVFRVHLPLIPLSG
jgi:signal transduction histidine kinase